MQNIKPIIAGNGIAIVLTVLLVLPITGVLAFVLTNPLDDLMMALGTWLSEHGDKPFADLENSERLALQSTQERFAKIGFAIRAIIIAVGLSFLYFWITTWLNQGYASIGVGTGANKKDTFLIAWTVLILAASFGSFFYFIGVLVSNWVHPYTFPLEELSVFITSILHAIRVLFVALGLLLAFFLFHRQQAHNDAVRQNHDGSFALASSERLIEAIQPWIFAGPAIVLLILFLLVPGLTTLTQSFQEADGSFTVTNYAFIWDPQSLGYGQFRFAMRNSLMWLILVPSVCIAFGLLIAVLADSTRWGVVAKTFIFVPMAISFVGAAVIWRNIFAGGGIEAVVADNGVTPSYQIGLLKALLGQGPDNNEPLYALEFWGNFFLMWILVWVQTGFAMVIFSAALRGVPEDTIEAATIDGATPVQMFFRIKLPQIYSTVVVVWTTLVILVLKMFDIPYALSANDNDKMLLATMMEDARTNWVVGTDNVENLFAAIAIMLMLTVVPNMIFNARRLRREQREMGH